MNGSLSPTTRFLVPLSLFIVGFALGAFMQSQVPRVPLAQPPQESGEKALEENLPVDPQILLNPIVYEWRGSVEGAIVEKKEDNSSFVVQDKEGNKITLSTKGPTGESWKTTFLKRDSSQKIGFAELSLADVEVGTKVRGDFWIFKTGKNLPVANLFTILEEGE